MATTRQDKQDAVAVQASEQTMALNQRLDPNHLISEAVQHGAGVDTLKELMQMSYELRDRNAQEAWHAAMARFQETVPTLVKSRDGHNYKYAGLGEILNTIRPPMGAVGLSVTFKQKFGPGNMTAICMIAHADGHIEETEQLVPIDTTGRMNSVQQYGSSATYARRYALLAALGLAPEDDDDAQSCGGPTRQPSTPMPERKGGNPPAVESFPEGEQTAVITSITRIDTVSGPKKGGGEWTKYGIVCGDGNTYGTFSETTRDAAKDYVGTGEEVTIWVQRNGRFLNAEGITEGPPDDVPVDGIDVTDGTPGPGYGDPEDIEGDDQ